MARLAGRRARLRPTLSSTARPVAHPPVIPTHFTVEDTAAGTELLIHLARPNPVWADIEVDPQVVVSVVDDYAYIPTTWRAKAGGPDEGRRPHELLRRRPAPVRRRDRRRPGRGEGRPARTVSSPTSSPPATTPRSPSGAAAPRAGCSPASAGSACRSPRSPPSSSTTSANPRAHRARAADRLEAQRGTGRDVGAAAQQRRRLARIGGWRAR